MPVKKLILYSRLECPLCEIAEELLQTEAVQYEFVDIDDSVDLIKQYHVRVPVLSNGQDELDWPFGAVDVRELADG